MLFHIVAILLAIPFIMVMVLLFVILLPEQVWHGILIIVASSLTPIAIIWAIWPTRYQIFNDKVRIVLGRPFHRDIRFDNLEAAIEGGLPDIFTLRSQNYITCFSRSIVIMVRKKGMNINTTPSNPDLFLENLNKAMAEWRKYNISY